MVYTVGSYNRKNYGSCTNWALCTRVCTFPIATMGRVHLLLPCLYTACAAYIFQWGAAESHMYTGPSWWPRPIVLHKH